MPAASAASISGRGLAHAREHDLLRIPARRDHARELAARHNVESATRSREEIQHRKVGVRLDGVADKVRLPVEGGIELAIAAFDGGAGIDEARRAEALGDGCKRDTLGVELAADQAQNTRVRCAPCGAHDFGVVENCGSGGSGGPISVPDGVVDGGVAGRSGPLMPQPVAATATHATASTTAIRARREARMGMAKSRNIERNPSTQRFAAMTTDSEFMAATDRVLAAIGVALDAALAEADIDVDWNLNEGILEIECEDGSKIIVNRHLPNREIWVAAKSGGFHFGVRDGGWRDTRSGTPLAVTLAALLKAQAGLHVALPPLPAPA